MITKIFNNGNSRDGLVLKPVSELTRLGVEFDTIESRDLFCSQFPKSTKVYCGFINGYENGQSIRNPFASLYIMETTNYDSKQNKITGDSNESGNKRMIRFYNAVSLELQKQK